MNEATRRQLTELRKKAERAAGRAVARERRLFVAGAPVHDWERHQEQLRAIRAERNQVLAEVRREAERITREQRELLESINDGISRADALEPFERSEAISRLTLAEKEIRTLSEGVIRRRLEYVREHGSKLEKFAWAEAAAGRERELLERRNDATSSGGPAPRAGVQSASTSFSEALDRLEIALCDPIYQERSKHAQGALSEAEQLSEFCYTRARDAESMAGAYRRERSAIRPIVEQQKYERGGRPPAHAPEPPAQEGAVAS